MSALRLLAATVAAISLVGCIPLDLSVCGTHEWTVEQDLDDPGSSEEKITVSFDSNAQFRSYSDRITSIEVASASLEIVEVLANNVATKASGILEIAADDDSERLAVGEYRDIAVEAGRKIELELTEAGKTKIGELLTTGSRKFQAYVKGDLDQVPAHLKLRARFELVAHVGNGGFEIDLGCVDLTGTSVTAGVCAANPCQNGGTCAEADENAFTCTCAGGYTGALCEVPPADACDPNPCDNGGTCEAVGESFQCICADGFSGQTCADEETTSACEPNPCENGGTCTETDDSFECTCADGFGGDTCELPV